MYDLFIRAFQSGTDVARVACGLLPSLIHVIETTPHFVNLCIILRHIADDTDGQHMLLDDSTFTRLSWRMTSPEHTKRVTDIIKYGNMFNDESIRAVVYRGMDFCIKQPHLCDLEMLERCTTYSRWVDELMPKVVHLWQTGWPVHLGTLLSQMLLSTSAELIIKLEKKHKLDLLISMANEHASVGNSTWRVVRARLYHHWPARTNTILKGNRCTGTPIPGHECPITLNVMTHPVVASDGNTYERDAIMMHMSKLGMFSPLTKEPLGYHLYENRCLS